MFMLIKNGRIVSDAWKTLTLAKSDTPQSVRLPVGPVLVPLSVWQARRAELIYREYEHGWPLGIWLAAEEGPEEDVYKRQTHNNRAAALHHLGETEENPERLEEAIRSYEKALTVSMEQQLPIHLAVLCRVNKTTAQNVLAELTNDTGLAEEVADEFEVIIECFSHALQPLCLRHCEEQMDKARSLALANSASR